MSAPICILQVNTNPQSGKVIGVKVCNTCLGQHRERAFLDAWCKAVDYDPEKVRWAVCVAHYQLTQEERHLD